MIVLETTTFSQYIQFQLHYGFINSIYSIFATFLRSLYFYNYGSKLTPLESFVYTLTYLAPLQPENFNLKVNFTNFLA